MEIEIKSDVYFEIMEQHDSDSGMLHHHEQQLMAERYELSDADYVAGYLNTREL